MKGLLLNITGNGKGKSTSAFGTIIRALGWDWNVALLQFVKGSNMNTGEQQFFQQLSSSKFIFEQLGCGYTWAQGNHAGSALEAWQRTEELLKQPKLQLLVLDELNVALDQHLLDINEVITALQNRPAPLNVIITGRGAPQKLLEISDLISRIDSVKHPFDSGISAREGLDF
ncbi:MAG: cob(I)yrinic acid a,c-diamide adenosyltransferase [Victivallaceae bacterium]|nr:cob(I)yrinic acid a,c-diamide adenosyltransferase [Victivallaceae bacterium]